jgi:hypothetical protein
MKAIRLTLAFLILPILPAMAADLDQSYIRFADQGAVIVQEDGRQVDASANLPVFPGDEVRTARRGRAEIRLSDGNVVAFDRATAIRFRSILASYEGDSSQTVAELLYGAAIVHRRAGDRAMRLDTTAASYLSDQASIFSIETDGRGTDTLKVFEGVVEVRTPAGSTRVREGELVKLDERGVYDSRAVVRSHRNDFEAWYLGRADRYRGRSARYLDRSLAYAEYDLDAYGSWIYVADYGAYAWRPTVGIGWRPYHHGRWSRSPGGVLIWISDEPWGWVPYHYGRWTYASRYGWIWVPGRAYSPAWVYWIYGPSYIGWAPAGYWDCFPGYYNWLYRPYSRHGYQAGFGFHGRVRLTDVDGRAGWTFMAPDRIFTNRADQAALTIDAVRGRLRDGRVDALLTNEPARFGRDAMRDPTSAVETISRRGIGSGTGKEGSGSVPDATSFLRRDPELSPALRERLSARRGGDESAGATAATRGGEAAPATSGRTGIARDAGAAGERVARPAAGETARPAVSRPVDRGSGEGRSGSVERPATREPVDRPAAREQIERPAARDPVARPESSGGAVREQVRREAPAAPSGGAQSQWRERGAAAPAATRDGGAAAAPRREYDRSGERPQAPARQPVSGEDFRSRPAPRSDGDSSATREAPSRRVIDSIGGVRMRPAEPPTSPSSGEVSRPSRESGSSSGSVSRPSRESSSDSGSRSGARIERPSSSGSSDSSSSSGGSSSTRSSGSSSGSSSSGSSGSSSRGSERVTRDRH